MSYQRPYQGYPYVNPLVIDVPSISAVDAARWNHLPRRQVEVNRRETQVSLPLQELSGSLSSVPDKNNREALDNDAADRYTDAHDFEAQERSQGTIPEKRNSDSSPVVYIDMPEASGSHVADRVTEGQDSEVIEPQTSNSEPKGDPDAPVLYIDLPEADGSLTQNRDQTTPAEPEFVQETIFYDPFENRRIDGCKPEEPRPESEGGSCERPRRPNVLDLSGPPRATSSARTSSPFPSSSGISSMSKEADIYGRTDPNGFPTSPIPVSQFPEPPPAYTEIDVSTPVVEQVPVVEQPRAEEPPRTQVIVHREQVSTPTGVPHADRKFLNCHHCGMRVHTLVIRENGSITHVTAAACCILCFIPGCAWAYCTKYFKVRNHYCPNCNKIIAYQLPMTTNKIFYLE